MADIWVSRKCSACGEQVTPGEKAVLVAVVKTTAEEAYGGFGLARKRKVRVNFFSGSDRSLQHITCHTRPEPA